MTTIVSAFISNVNSRNDRSLNTYFQIGKLLLKSNTPKIIFLDEIMYNLIQPTDYNKENTLIIPYNKLDSYLYHYIDSLHNFHLKTDNSSKDTLEYMFTICNKTEWIRIAIENDIFNSKNFVWVDFGIRHVFKCSDDEFIQKLDNLQHKQYNYTQVRIGHIWNLSIQYNIDILREVAWYFAGGVFGGDKQSLLTFSQLMKNKCIEIITTHKTIIWEVNIWYLLYKENKSLFDPYLSNHNESLIDAY